MPNLSEYPLPIAILVAGIWGVQQIIAANSKQITALIDAFDKQYGVLAKNYEALVQAAAEDRQEARQRWLERDRLLNERLERATIELAQNKNETHALRNAVQMLITDLQLFLRKGGASASSRTGTSKPNIGGADD